MEVEKTPIRQLFAIRSEELVVWIMAKCIALSILGGLGCVQYMKSGGGELEDIFGIQAIIKFLVWSVASIVLVASHTYLNYVNDHYLCARSLFYLNLFFLLNRAVSFEKQLGSAAMGVAIIESFLLTSFSIWSHCAITGAIWVVALITFASTVEFTSTYLLLEALPLLFFIATGFLAYQYIYLVGLRVNSMLLDPDSTIFQLRECLEALENSALQNTKTLSTDMINEHFCEISGNYSPWYDKPCASESYAVSDYYKGGARVVMHERIPMRRISTGLTPEDRGDAADYPVCCIRLRSARRSVVSADHRSFTEAPTSSNNVQEADGSLEQSEARHHSDALEVKLHQFCKSMDVENNGLYPDPVSDEVTSNISFVDQKPITQADILAENPMNDAFAQETEHKSALEEAYHHDFFSRESSFSRRQLSFGNFTRRIISKTSFFRKMSTARKSSKTMDKSPLAKATNWITEKINAAKGFAEERISTIAAATLKREQIVLPDMAHFTFKDHTLEQWYLIWHAESVIWLYLRSFNLTLTFFVMNALFVLNWGFWTFFKVYQAEKESNQTTAPSYSSYLAMYTDNLVWVLAVRPFVKLAVDVSLLYAAKWVQPEGFKTVWKHNLLMLLIIVSHIFFMAFDMILICGRTFGYTTKNLRAIDVASNGSDLITIGSILIPFVMIAIQLHLRPPIMIGSLLVALLIVNGIYWYFSVPLTAKLSYGFLQDLITQGFLLGSLIIAICSFNLIWRAVFYKEVMGYLLYIHVFGNTEKVMQAIQQATEFSEST